MLQLNCHRPLVLQSNKKLSRTFGAAKQLFPKNSEEESYYKRNTYIQSEYVGNPTKMILFEARLITYDITAPFLIPNLLDEYVLKVKYIWGNGYDTVVNLFKQ